MQKLRLQAFGNMKSNTIPLLIAAKIYSSVDEQIGELPKLDITG